MSILFRAFMWYQNRFGMMPKIIKQLRMEGKHEDANRLAAALEKLKRNPPKSTAEAVANSYGSLEQSARDSRLAGDHEEAERIDQMIKAMKSKRPL